MDNIEVVKRNGLMLVLIKEQIPDVCLAAVQQNGLALRDVNEQTPEICLAAVQQNGKALHYVKQQTPEICIAAIKNNIVAFNYIKIVFNISPVIKIFDKKIDIHLLNNNFIKNLFIFKIYKLDTVKKYLTHKDYDIQLIKLLQEYNYAFSEEQILESIKHKIEIPYVHQYGYNLNSPEFIQEFNKYGFYPESYNLDIS